MRDRRHRVDRQTAVNGRPRSPLTERGTRGGGYDEGVSPGRRGLATVLAEGVRKRREHEQRRAGGNRRPD